ncbi:MAG TPA: ATP-binding protein, partial [Gemmatimonadaceae bacterium]
MITESEFAALLTSPEGARLECKEARSRYDFDLLVRQYVRRLEVVSPGGFPPGITLENVLDQQNPRNRRLAEAFARCGLI